MRIRIAPLTEDLLPATRSLNSRLGINAPFFLPERLPASPSAMTTVSSGITWTHYVAMDDSEARGGFLLMDQPVWINGEINRASNYQSVLSEGIRDRRYGAVSVHMLKYIEQRAPYAFLVGMGNAQNPLPRLLKGSGWALRPVPFLFRVHNVRNFLREMRIFRKGGYWRMAARAASISGAGWMGIRLLQARPLAGSGSLGEVTVDRVTSWGSWADELWAHYRNHCSFAVVRDRATLNQLYPLTEGRMTGALVTNGPAPIGWAVWQDTPMKDDKYFGNLRVVTILDSVAVPRFADIFARSITRHLEDPPGDSRAGGNSPDLVITNQNHLIWTRAFRRAGFLSAASNYLLATSKPLTQAIHARGGTDRIHLTRGDGDGRIHL